MSTTITKNSIGKKEIFRMYQELYNLGSKRADAIDMLPLDDLKKTFWIKKSNSN